MIKKYLTIICLSAFCILFIIDAGGLWLLRRHNATVHIKKVLDLNSLHINNNSNGLEVFKEKFSGRSPVEIMEKVMNFVPRQERFDSFDPVITYQHVQNGGGLACSGMANLYSASLSSNGFEHRQILLMRNPFGIYDTHTLIEVFQDGRWVIYDPTFNVSYKIKNRLIGAQDISETLHGGSFYEVIPVFYGEVAYPVRLETYSMNWLPLYNNVFVMEHFNVGLLQRLPPFRYWFGPTLYWQSPIGEDNLPVQWFEFQDIFYFWTIVIIPIMCLILFFITIFLAINIKKNGSFHDRE